MFCGQEFQITCLLEVLVIFVVVFCTWIFVSEIWLSVPSRKVNLLVVSSSFSFILWWNAMERMERMCLRIFAWMNDVVSVLSYGKIAIKRSSMYRCARKYVVVGFVRVIML